MLERTTQLNLSRGGRTLNIFKTNQIPGEDNVPLHGREMKRKVGIIKPCTVQGRPANDLGIAQSPGCSYIELGCSCDGQSALEMFEKSEIQDTLEAQIQRWVIFQRNFAAQRQVALVADKLRLFQTQ